MASQIHTMLKILAKKYTFFASRTKIKNYIHLLYSANQTEDIYTCCIQQIKEKTYTPFVFSKSNKGQTMLTKQTWNHSRYRNKNNGSQKTELQVIVQQNYRTTCKVHQIVGTKDLACNIDKSQRHSGRCSLLQPWGCGFKSCLLPIRKIYILI